MAPSESPMSFYVQACDNSSKRGRSVLVVMIIASVLIFSSWWNNREGSWTNSAMRLYGAVVSLEQGNPVPDEGLAQRARDLRAQYGPMESDALVKIMNDGIRDLVQLQTERFHYFTIPFFGVSVDFNDVGVLGGFALMVTMMWLWFSLRREQSNVTVTFREAERRDLLEEVYRRLSMTQVLTVPSTRGRKSHRVWNLIPKLLFVLPLAVQTGFLVNDFSTREDAYILSPPNTLVMLTLGTAFLAATFLLTIQCVLASLRIDRAWSRAAALRGKRAGPP